jgi:monoamine oxidase
MATKRLRGTRVLIAGAGLAGLAAALELEEQGAEVDVFEARARVGGRVWTIRDTFAGGQHAEGGADLIEEDHTAVFDLARRLNLETTRVLRHGFGYYGKARRGGRRIQDLSAALAPVRKPLNAATRAYRLAEQRWDGAIAAALGRQSVAEWLEEIGAPKWARDRFCGFRGLFLADPEDLSALALIDFLSADPSGRPGRLFRVVGGNDSLARAVAARLERQPQLETVVRRVRHTREGVTITVERAGRRAEVTGDFLISSVPATTLRHVVVEPDLPEPQREAIRRLRYGSATRVLLQFDRRFWRRTGRPRAFGTDTALGALWEGNEDQRGSAGILSLLAGGGASKAVNEILERDGWDGVIGELAWLGKSSTLIRTARVRWEDDPWAGGGYAYFDPGFDPRWREALALPIGRLLFAGEHTSLKWQGYMNGAVESGQRAAAELVALQRAFSPQPSNRR